MPPRRVVAPEDVPKHANSSVVESKGTMMFEKTVSIQVQHGETIHTLDPKFPLKNLVRFSLKIAEEVRLKGPIPIFQFKASTGILYDSMPYHRVINLVRATSDLSRNPKRKEIRLQVRGFSLSQIAQVFWIAQCLDLAHPVQQDWLKDYITKQFPKNQGVAQLDVDALRTILQLYSEEGEIQTLAIDYMEEKVAWNLLEPKEREKLAVLRKDFPELASRLGGPLVPPPAAATPASSWKAGNSAFPPLGGGRGK